VEQLFDLLSETAATAVLSSPAADDPDASRSPTARITIRRQAYDMATPE